MKKVLSIVLSAVMLISCFSFAVFAEGEIVLDEEALLDCDYVIDTAGQYVINEDVTIPEGKTLYLGSGAKVNVFGSVKVLGNVISRGGEMVAKASYDEGKWSFGQIINSDNLIGDGFEAEIVFNGFPNAFIAEDHYLAKAKYCCSENGSDYEDLKYFYLNCSDSKYVGYCESVANLETELYNLQLEKDEIDDRIFAIYQAAEEVRIYHNNGYNAETNVTRLFNTFPVMNELQGKYVWPAPSNDYDLKAVYDDLKLEADGKKDKDGNIVIRGLADDRNDRIALIAATNKELAKTKLEKQKIESELIANADITSWPNDIWANLSKVTRDDVTVSGQNAKVLKLPLNQYFFFRFRMVDKDAFERYDSSVMRFTFNGVAVEKAQGTFKLFVSTAGEISYAGADGTSTWNGAKYVYDTGWSETVKDAYTKKYNVYLDNGTGYRVYGVNGEVTGAAETVRLRHGEEFTFRVDINKDYDQSDFKVYFVNAYQWNDERYAVSLEEMALDPTKYTADSDKTKALFDGTTDAGIFSVEFTDGAATDRKICYRDEYGIYHVDPEIVKGPFSICVTGVVKNETISFVGRLIETLRNIFTTISNFFAMIFGR